MTVDAELVAVPLERGWHALTSFHVLAIASFRDQLEAAIAAKQQQGHGSILRPRGFELEALIARLVSDLTVDSVDALREGAAEMMHIVKGEGESARGADRALQLTPEPR